MQQLSDFPDAHLRIFERPQLPAAELIQDVYFIGICGTGMGSLAGLLKQAGCTVRGSDSGVYPPMSTRLAEMSIPIHDGYTAAHLDDAPDLVVVGNACVPTHVEAAVARERGLTQASLPETLAHFFLRTRRPLVVAGTHGKTTTTGMLVHILRATGRDPGFLVGGVMNEYGDSYDVGSGPHFVVEGDEYDSAYFDKEPKFMHYNPASAIVTSLEFDHADIYSDMDDYRQAFERFVALVKPPGVLALWGDDPGVRALASCSTARIITFGLLPDTDITATNIERVAAGQRFTLKAEGRRPSTLFLPMSGRHNLLNALAACTIALSEGLSVSELEGALSTFKGMKRRQEILGEFSGVLVVDDFAHHPTAVRETIRAAHERWPNRRLIAVFEPRSNSSRRKAFEKPYADAFADASKAYLSTPPFRHNDDRSRFMDTKTLVRTITARGTPARVFSGADHLLRSLIGDARSGDVVLVMSNGGFGGLQQHFLSALRKRSALEHAPPGSLQATGLK